MILSKGPVRRRAHPQMWVCPAPLPGPLPVGGRRACVGAPHSYRLSFRTASELWPPNMSSPTVRMQLRSGGTLFTHAFVRRMHPRRNGPSLSRKVCTVCLPTRRRRQKLCLSRRMRQRTEWPSAAVRSDAAAREHLVGGSGNKGCSRQESRTYRGTRTCSASRLLRRNSKIV